jgi:hypothetical protein
LPRHAVIQRTLYLAPRLDTGALELLHGFERFARVKI